MRTYGLLRNPHAAGDTPAPLFSG
ncbi:protein of unknown function (plasmid) [Aminobacter niigataensis]|nr:protein of unknown function [Aminobacter niigataensis]